VVLLQNLRFGKKGTVVEVNPGWMRYKLFPQNKAVYATPENVAKYSMSEEERAELEDSSAVQRRRLVKLINSLTTAQVNISRRSNWMSKKPDEMSGSVSAWDVQEAVARQLHIRLHDSHLLMDSPITGFGTFKVPLNLRTLDDKQVELTVVVKSVRFIRHGHASV